MYGMLRVGRPRGEPGAQRGTSMAQGGASRLVQQARIVAIAIPLLAAGAAAEEPNASAERLSPVLRSAAARALPPRAGSLGDAAFLGMGAPSLRGAPPWLLRPGPPPARGDDLFRAAASKHGGAPLYGVLAGQALLSTLHLHGDLPDHMTPWFDVDPERMTAGFELSF